MHFQRVLDLEGAIEKKSIFLFGPRQTGKTSLIKETFLQAPIYNLLEADQFLRLTQRPQLMREELLSRPPPKGMPVVVDEIQKLPILLDEVHHLIENKGFRFLLTGSSARKLKRGGANLLGGRVRTRHLFPLVSKEIPNYDLNRILNFGSLPSIYLSSEPEEDLADYVGNYLKEEIQAEGLARRIENFSKFLQTASLYNAELINFANVGSDAGVPPRTVREYFSILKDTLIGEILEPFTKTKKFKAITTAKFYYFDIGVCNFLAGRKNVVPKTELFGKVLEHFIFTELRAYLDYQRKTEPLSFWRSTSGYEVDFLIGDSIGIEVKGADNVSERHLSGLKALSTDLSLTHQIVVSMDKKPRRIGKIEILPVADFLESLWSGGVV